MSIRDEAQAIAILTKMFAEWGDKSDRTERARNAERARRSIAQGRSHRLKA